MVESGDQMSGVATHATEHAITLDCQVGASAVDDIACIHRDASHTELCRVQEESECEKIEAEIQLNDEHSSSL